MAGTCGKEITYELSQGAKGRMTLVLIPELVPVIRKDSRRVRTQNPEMVATQVQSGSVFLFSSMKWAGFGVPWAHKGAH